MKLFISWSGEFSKKVAECLSIWIPTIIQTVDVFYSPNDIAKGENWSSRLSDELEQSNFGIVCLTPENISAPWIHFEAGALSKVANSRVSAIMLGVSPSDVKGPLARFQNTTLNREDFHRLFLSINNSNDTPLRTEFLTSAFNNSWESLMSDITSIIKDYSSCTKSEKIKGAESSSDSHAIQEILRLARNMNSSINAFLPSLTSAPDFSEPARAPRNCSVFLHCPKEDVDIALCLIREFSDDLLRDTGPLVCRLKEHGSYIVVQLPRNNLDGFKEKMRKFAPNTKVELLNAYS